MEAYDKNDRVERFFAFCSKIKSMLVIVSVFMLSVIFILCAVPDFSGDVQADEDDSMDFTFYQLSSAAAGYMSVALAPGTGKGAGSLAKWDYGDGPYDGRGCTIGSAGSLVGFCDEEATGGISGWITSLMSSSSASYAYETFVAVPCNEDNTVVNNSCYIYCRYGYLLADLGLDDTATDSSFNFLRVIAGGSVLILYIMAQSVAVIFNWILGALIMLNPFRLFSLKTPNSALSNGPQLDTITDGPFVGLANTVSNWYVTFSNFSWEFLLPFFFVFMIISVTLFKRSDKWKTVKRYIFRIVFLCAGVPLCGVLYTSALESMQAAVSHGNGSATRVVASSFCDFETWAKQLRLAPPPGAVLESLASGSSGKGSNASVAALHDTCYAINSYSGLVSRNGVMTPAEEGYGSRSMKWNNSALHDTSSTTTAQELMNIVDLLGRYMHGDHFYASDWETMVKADMSRRAKANSEYDTKVYEMVECSDEIDDYKTSKNDYAKERFNRRNWKSTNGTYANIFANGSLTASSGMGEGTVGGAVNNSGGSDAIADTTINSTYRFGNEKDMPDGEGKSWICSKTWGLSTLSMYNYLTTKFTSSGLTVYSNEKSSSGLIKESHFAVNMIGTGVMGFLYWLNMIIILGCLVILGYFYALSILINNVKRTIRVITAVPFALLGSIRSIAKVVTYTIMLIVEVMVTMFVYVLVAELMMGLTSAIEQPVSGLFDALAIVPGQGAVPAGIMAGSPALIILVQVFSIIIMIAFTVMAVRLRKTIVKSVDEAAGEIINKFFDVSGPQDVPKQPGMLAKAGGAVASGAGMAAGARMMNGIGGMGGAKGGSGGSASGTKNVAPGGPGGGGGSGSGGIENGEGQMPSAGDTGGAQGAALGGSSADAAALEGGSGGGAGMAVGAATDAAFADNNAEQSDRDLGEKLMMSQTLSEERMESDAAQDEVRQQATIDEMTGRTSAVESEQNAEDRDEMAKKQREEGMKQALTGGAQTLVGAAEIAGGAYTGDVSLIQDGVKNTANGSAAMSEGQDKASHAGRDAQAAVDSRQAQRNEGRSMTGDNLSNNAQSGAQGADAQSVSGQDGMDVQASVSGDSADGRQPQGSDSGQLKGSDGISQNAQPGMGAVSDGGISTATGGSSTNISNSSDAGDKSSHSTSSSTSSSQNSSRSDNLSNNAQSGPEVSNESSSSSSMRGGDSLSSASYGASGSQGGDSYDSSSSYDNSSSSSSSSLSASSDSTSVGSFSQNSSSVSSTRSDSSSNMSLSSGGSVSNNSSSVSSVKNMHAPQGQGAASGGQKNKGGGVQSGQRQTKGVGSVQSKQPAQAQQRTQRSSQAQAQSQRTLQGMRQQVRQARMQTQGRQLASQQPQGAKAQVVRGQQQTVKQSAPKGGQGRIIQQEVHVKRFVRPDNTPKPNARPLVQHDNKVFDDEI